MADKKISELPVATAATGTELAEIVQGGVNKQTTLQDIANLGGGGSVTSVTGTSNRITSTGGATPVIDIDAAYDAAVTAEIVGSRVLGLAFSDELTPITAGTDKLTFHFPYTTTIQEIWIELKTAQASGTIFTVDVHKAGTTILSTKLTIDNTEETSLTAAAPPVISVAAVTKGDKITIDVDQVGNGTAIGGKIWFRG